VALLEVDEEVPADVMEKITQLPSVKHLRQLHFAC